MEQPTRQETNTHRASEDDHEEHKNEDPLIAGVNGEQALEEEGEDRVEDDQDDHDDEYDRTAVDILEEEEVDDTVDVIGEELGGSFADHDGEEERAVDVLPAYLWGPLDPTRMELTAEERQWALQVKEAIANTAELDTISDFKVAQIALVEWGSRNLEKAIEHATTWQAYREDSEILDTVQQGKRMLDYYVRRHPGYIIHFFRSEQRYSMCFDLTRFDTSALSEIDGLKKSFQACYYLFHAFCPDLAAIREGVDWNMECEGFLWKAPKMMNFDIMRIGFEDITANYPLHINKWRFYNTGVIINTLTSMMRRYVPGRIHKKLEIGCKTEARMDTICLVPSLEVAMDRLVREMTESLRRRYEAEHSFRL